MSCCDEYAVKLLRYLESSLRGSDLQEFRAHVELCVNCRARLDAEQRLSQLLQRSRPLYLAPVTLRARVAEAAARHSATTQTRGGRYERFLQMVKRRSSVPVRHILNARILTPTLVTTALVLLFVPNAVRQARASSYVETAVTFHRSYVIGNLRPGLCSSSPELVTAWFADKVPFHFRLPSAEPVPYGKSAYRLTGAGLAKYQGAPVALVTYEKEGEKISLLVASSESAVVAGGDELHFGSLMFHYRTDHGFKVITWSNHGLSYALVSSITGSARESCLVCHQNMADHRSFGPGL
jgi:anti-sigma factor (TIGR02949 family)